MCLLFFSHFCSCKTTSLTRKRTSWSDMSPLEILCFFPERWDVLRFWSRTGCFNHHALNPKGMRTAWNHQNQFQEVLNVFFGRYFWDGIFRSFCFPTKSLLKLGMPLKNHWVFSRHTGGPKCWPKRPCHSERTVGFPRIPFNDTGLPWVTYVTWWIDSANIFDDCRF